MQCGIEFVHNGINVMLLDCKRGCQQDVITSTAIDGAAHRIADQACVESGLLEQFVETKICWQWLPAIAVGNELHAKEQTAVASMCESL